MNNKAKSVNQRVGNRGRERGLARADAFAAYAMDRLLHRLGRSQHAKEFYLKGGVLVADLLGAPHRFTRDIDMLRRHGRPSPDDLRQIFREIVAVPADDGITFDSEGVRAIAAEHDEDGYDGVKVFLRGTVDRMEVDVRVDIGFGDAVVPRALRRPLSPFLEDDESAKVMVYDVRSVIAEKIEALVSKFPVVQHRLKDILDVVTLADACAFNGRDLVNSVTATFDRRASPSDPEVLDDMRTVTRKKDWKIAWATMLKEKAVTEPFDLAEAVGRFDVFVRPILVACAGQGAPPGEWPAQGPWGPQPEEAE